MQIQAKADRDAGKRILCNGQIFVVAPGGALCRDGETEPADVDPDTADKLLQNTRTWEPYGTPKTRAPQQPRPKPRVQLLDKHGDVVPVEAPEQPPAAAELEQGAGPPAEATEPAESPPDVQASEVSPSPGELSGRDPPIPSEGGEWADPKPDFSLTWLRACAKAYRIPYGPRTKPETLCQRIMAAMYDGSEGKENDASA